MNKNNTKSLGAFAAGSGGGGGGATYTAGTGIDINESNEISVAAPTYTQSNLIAAEPLSIIDEPVIGGIDDNTLACWHLDWNTNNEVAGSQMTFDRSEASYSSQRKFTAEGASLTAYSYAMYIRNPLTTLTTWTLDFLIKTSFGGAILERFAASTSFTNALNLSIGTNNVVEILDGSTSIISGTDSITSGWNHIAITVSNKKMRLYLNGVQQGEYTASNDIVLGSSAVQYSLCFPSHVNYNQRFYDEIRISDIVRSDFIPTPYEVPYSVAVPTGKKQIMLDTSSVGEAPEVHTYTNQSSSTIATGVTLAFYDTILVYKNGVLQTEGSGNDYTISGNNVVFDTSLVTTDIVTVVLMGKISGEGANKRLSNLDDEGKIQVAHLAAMSNTYVDLTFTKLGTYTAPADGQFCIFGQANGGGGFWIAMSNNGEDGATSPIIDFESTSSGDCMSVCLDVKKGDVVKVDSFGGATFKTTNQRFYFRYAVGNASEAN